MHQNRATHHPKVATGRCDILVKDLRERGAPRKVPAKAALAPTLP